MHHFTGFRPGFKVSTGRELKEALSHQSVPNSKPCNNKTETCGTKAEGRAAQQIIVAAKPLGGIFTIINMNLTT
jgi:hypothetical protein